MKRTRYAIDEKHQCEICGFFVDIEELDFINDNEAVCMDCDDITDYTLRVVDETIKRIEACGASPELTNAVDLLSDFRHAYATKSKEYLLIAIRKLKKSESTSATAQ